jgi:hypothetical protein
MASKSTVGNTAVVESVTAVVEPVVEIETNVEPNEVEVEEFDGVRAEPGTPMADLESMGNSYATLMTVPTLPAGFDIVGAVIATAKGKALEFEGELILVDEANREYIIAALAGLDSLRETFANVVTTRIELFRTTELWSRLIADYKAAVAGAEKALMDAIEAQRKAAAPFDADGVVDLGDFESVTRKVVASKARGSRTKMAPPAWNLSRYDFTHEGESYAAVKDNAGQWYIASKSGTALTRKGGSANEVLRLFIEAKGGNPSVNAAKKLNAREQEAKAAQKPA